MGGLLPLSNPSDRGRLLDMKYVLRVIASALYFALVGCVSLSQVLGDCFASAQHTCPTDAQGNARILIIWIAGLLVYFGLGWFLLRRERGR